MCFAKCRFPYEDTLLYKDSRPQACKPLQSYIISTAEIFGFGLIPKATFSKKKNLGFKTYNREKIEQ